MYVLRIPPSVMLCNRCRAKMLARSKVRSDQGSKVTSHRACRFGTSGSVSTDREIKASTTRAEWERLFNVRVQYAGSMYIQDYLPLRDSCFSTRNIEHGTTCCERMGFGAFNGQSREESSRHAITKVQSIDNAQGMRPLHAKMHADMVLVVPGFPADKHPDSLPRVQLSNARGRWPTSSSS